MLSFSTFEFNIILMHTPIIFLTPKGFRGKGRYIGRSKNRRLGIFGNPFPVKKSKFSSKIYSLEESLTLYARWIEDQYRSNSLFKEEADKLLKELKEKGHITLDCWCVETAISSEEHKPTKCHGEVLAVFLLRKISNNYKIVGG